MSHPTEPNSPNEERDSGELAGDIIIVGYDQCDHAEIALDWAAGEAHDRGAALEVVTTSVPTGGTVWPEGAFDVMSESALQVAQLTAQEGAERARSISPDVSVTASSVMGSPAGALVEVSGRAALVVVGTRGHGDFAGLLLGSVAFAVTAHAKCPVVVVRGDRSPAGPDRPVLVGVDGSAGSLDAVGYAARAAAAHGAELILLTAWLPQSSQAMGYLTADYPPDLAQRHASELLDLAEERAAEEDPPPATVTRQPCEGLPGEALSIASERAGLVLVGARGHGGFAGLNLGSVSHTLIRRSGCPVVVVRH